MLQPVSLATGTIALHRGLGLATVNPAGDLGVGSCGSLATQAIGELLQLVLGEVLWCLPLFADVATDPVSCQIWFIEATITALTSGEGWSDPVCTVFSMSVF